MIALLLLLLLQTPGQPWAASTPVTTTPPGIAIRDPQIVWAIQTPESKVRPDVWVLTDVGGVRIYDHEVKGSHVLAHPPNNQCVVALQHRNQTVLVCAIDEAEEFRVIPTRLFNKWAKSHRIVSESGADLWVAEHGKGNQ